MSKSHSCTIILCSKCRNIIQKDHTRTGERYKQPWTFRGKHPICYVCLEKNLDKKKEV